MAYLAHGVSAPEISASSLPLVSDLPARIDDCMAETIACLDSLGALFVAIEHLAGRNNPTIGSLADLGQRLAAESLMTLDAVREEWEGDEEDMKGEF